MTIYAILLPIGVLYISALCILLYRGLTRDEIENLKQGIELVARLIDGALQRKYIPLALEMPLLRARMYVAIGNNQESLADVAHAVELAEPEGFISVFVEEGPSIAKTYKVLVSQDG